MVDTLKMTAILKFVFMFYTYKGFNNTYKLAYIGFGLSTH